MERLLELAAGRGAASRAGFDLGSSVNIGCKAVNVGRQGLRATEAGMPSVSPGSLLRTARDHKSSSSGDGAELVRERTKGRSCQSWGRGACVAGFLQLQDLWARRRRSVGLYVLRPARVGRVAGSVAGCRLQNAGRRYLAGCRLRVAWAPAACCWPYLAPPAYTGTGLLCRHQVSARAASC